ncbi:MAG: response regulator transcription factor [Bacillota bacterium]
MGLKVLLAGGEALFRESLAAALRAAGLQVKTCSASVDDVVAAATQFVPDAIVCSVPTVDRGVLDLLRLLHEKLARGNVLLVVGRSDPAGAYHALRAGAAGYVPRAMGLDQLLHAVAVVAAGHCLVPAGVLADLLRAEVGRPGLTEGELTRRQVRILGAIGQGLSDRQIARALGLSEPLVKSEVKAILRKTGTRNRAEAVATALKRGVIS